MKGICIIPNKNDSINIEIIYSKIQEKYKNVFLLQPESFICPLKFTDDFLYVNMAKTCEHTNIKFVNANKIENILDMIEERKIEIENIQNNNGTVEKNIDIDRTGNIKNDNGNNVDNSIGKYDKKTTEINYDYKTRLETDKTSKSYIEEDNTNYELNESETNITFLIKRLAQIEKIKNKTIFTIFFTMPFYSLTKKVKNFLHTHDKLAYLVYLNDFSYERLTCIDNTEVAVLVDCQDHYDIELLIPLVTPFDILLAFDKSYKWNGEYNKNYFEVKQDQIVKTENSVELLNKKLFEIELVSVKIENEESGDDFIYEGRRGIASEYENEGK